MDTDVRIVVRCYAIGRQRGKTLETLVIHHGKPLVCEGPRRIIVSVDGTRGDQVVLSWAASVAVAERLNVEILCASAALRPFLARWFVGAWGEAYDVNAAQHALDAAETIARHAAGQLPQEIGVTWHVSAGNTFGSLRQAAQSGRYGAVVVAAGRRRRWLARRLGRGLSVPVVSIPYCSNGTRSEPSQLGLGPRVEAVLWSDPGGHPGAARGPDAIEAVAK